MRTKLFSKEYKILLRLIEKENDSSLDELKDILENLYQNQLCQEIAFEAEFNVSVDELLKKKTSE